MHLIFSQFPLIYFADPAKWTLACLDVWLLLGWCFLLRHPNAERPDQDEETKYPQYHYLYSAEAFRWINR